MPHDDTKINELIRKHEGSWRSGYAIFPALVQDKALRRGVEVGVAFGGHASAILERGGVEQLFGVDRYRHRSGYDDPMNLAQPLFDRLAQRVVERMAPFGERFKLIREDSAEAGERFEDQSLDFVYLDADHSEAGVWQDLQTWAIKVREGGIIAGHDYGHPDFPGVQRAVDRFFARFRWEVNAAGHGVWWVERRPLPVTFFTPCYNCAPWIKQAAASIVETNLKPGDEYILVNDGSTDGTANMLEAIEVMHHAVRVINHDENSGGSAARNTAVQAARSPLLFCLDADNILKPDSINTLRRELFASGSDVMAFQKALFFTDASGPEAPTHSHELEATEYDLAKYLSTTRVPGSGGNHLFTKASWQAVGGYPDSAGALDTWGFGLRVAGSGHRTGVAPGTSYLHRYSEDSYWNRHIQSGTVNRDAYELLRPYMDQIEPVDARYIASTKGQSQWFTGLNKRPIRLRESDNKPETDTSMVFVKKSLEWFRRKIASPDRAA